MLDWTVLGPPFNEMWGWMRAGFEQGLSGRAMMRGLREAGLHFADTKFWKGWRDIREQGGYGDFIRRQEDDFVVPRRMIAEPPLKFNTPYVAEFEVALFDEKGELIGTQTMWLGTEERLEKGVAETEIEDASVPEIYAPTAVASKATLTGWMHRSEWPW